MVQRSCLDHIFIKNNKLKAKGAALTKKISDHNFIMCWIWDDTNKINDELRDDRTTFTRYNDTRIIQELNNLNWNFIDNIECPNKMYEVINKEINKIYQNNTKLDSKKTSNKKV
jgi:hypothetical protein